MQARCRLGFERRVDAAICVSAFTAKADSQSSEHGVVATGEHDHSSSCLFVEGHVRLLRRPDAVEQNGQLTRHGHDCFVPRLLASSCSQM
jgi:hypothetical protein